ncbi:MAG: FG-GAP repeat protein [Vicinamibacterales bacterium]
MKIRAAAYVALAAGMSWVGGTAAARQQASRFDFAGRPSSAIRYLKASNPGEDDRIGRGDPLVGVGLAMSADGNTVVVSAPHEDSGATGVNPPSPGGFGGTGGNQRDESAWDSGAVYVFVRSGGRWTQQAYIKASNTQSSDRFGIAIALSGDGNTLAVGATLEDSGARGVNPPSPGGFGGTGGNQADNSAEAAGAVYVFARTGTTWAQQAYIKASNADAGDQFGWSVALSQDGSTLAIGAQSEASAATGIDPPSPGGFGGTGGNQADNSAADAGAAYVFVRRGSTWTQQAYIKPSNAQGADRFGFSITLSGDGNTLAVGSYDEDGSAKGVNGVSDEGAPNSGAAYVFVRRGAMWTQESYVKASNTVRNIAFGSSIALSADGATLAVGAVDETNLTRGIDGDQSSKPDNLVSAGAIYVFGRTGDGWGQQAYVKSFNIGPTDLFGIRLALSRDGSVLAAGAPGQTGGGRGFKANPQDFTAPESGAVYVFLRSAGRWTQDAYVKAPNAEAYDQFGSGVALSADGTTMAVAANGEDGGSGIDGNQNDNSVRDSGAVFVF